MFPVHLLRRRVEETVGDDPRVEPAVLRQQPAADAHQVQVALDSENGGQNAEIPIFLL